jgi:phosphoribosylformimino-5-aminoimidazole carboxamide ribonucleotide (ProFAR) isomerase
LGQSEESTGKPPGGTGKVALPLEHFDIIPAISIRKGRIVQAKGDKCKVDLIDVLYETFETILLVDLDGIFKNKPAIDLYRKISQLGDFWVDGGARYSDGVIDLLIGGAQYAVLGTKTLQNLDELKNAYELSENLIFGLDYNGSIMSPDENLRKRPPVDVIKEVKDIGLDSVLFTDTGRLETNKGLDLNQIKAFKDTGMKIYVSGGVKPSELGIINTLKVAGTIVELSEVLNNPAVFALDPGLLDEIAPNDKKD